MKCSLCGNILSSYQWSNIPNCEDKILCDNCAKAQLKSWLEDNGAEHSAEAASHYAKYKKLLKLFEKLEEDA